MRIKTELKLYWLFIKNDIWATVIPGLLITIVGITHVNYNLTNILSVLVVSFIYFNLYVYSFTLVNQLNGIDEDKVNKPYRPLPQRLITIKGVIIREIIAIFIFLIFSFAVGVLIWAISWTIIQLFHNFIGHKHWITKNLISMSLGIFVMIGAGWEIVVPLTVSQLHWAILIALIFGFCGVIQDFRDQEGDLKLNRKTLPLDVGDRVGRVISAFICIISLLLLYTFFISSIKTLTQVFMIILITILFAIVAIRILIRQSSKADHYTYMYLLYLFNILLLSGIFFV